ncbi:UNVERIFIED_CONTAM: Kinesin-like protein KIN-14I [Sesamum angustifolium]|uniref:Kinesin-like protein KIN-14I n=1 Tax=Sesamum angustifolium TaxID=2727405 RepID=A0AAW2IXI5_9LAMI
MTSDMAQSLRSSRSSFGSSNGFDAHSHNSYATSNGDDYDSDGSNFAPPTPNTLSSVMPPELAGAIPLIDKFQVEGFLRAMQKQIHSAGKRGFFSKKTVGLQDPIPTSLLKINSDLVSRAVKLFQVILKYMGVDSSDRVTPISLDESIELVSKLYKHALKRSELRDELFMQISKQTRNNPDRHSLIKAWELMYLCGSCMPPSKEIGGYLSEYVHTVAHSASSDSEVQVLAMNTLNALKRSVKAGPRHIIPGREEIDAVLTGKKLTTIVFFLDETFEEITYDMATTVADAVEMIKIYRRSTCRFKASKDRSKGEILHCKLTFKKKLFRESDEAITDPMFVQLSYVQLQHDYVLGNYPVGRDDAAQLSALQILAEIGYVVSPKHALFFAVRKIDDPIGLLPGKIILGINKRGVHFFRPVPKEYLHSAELRDIMQFGSSNTAVFFKMRVAGVLHIFQFETKQGEEICVALQTHINDVMLRRYSKARAAANGSINGHPSDNVRPPAVDFNEKRVLELSKSLEESENKVNQLQEDLHEKQKQELKIKEDLESLKSILRSEKQYLEEITCERDKLRTLCDEKDSALQAAFLEKQSIEVKFAKLNSQGLENNIRKELAETNSQVLRKTQEELKACSAQLHAVEESKRKLVNEKTSLEERLSRLERNNTDEIAIIKENFEQERKTMKFHIAELEKKLVESKRKLDHAQSAIAIKDAELSALQNNLRELEELREMKEDIDRKNEQTAAILKRQGLNWLRWRHFTRKNKL